MMTAVAKTDKMIARPAEWKWTTTATSLCTLPTPKCWTDRSEPRRIHRGVSRLPQVRQWCLAPRL